MNYLWSPNRVNVQKIDVKQTLLCHRTHNTHENIYQSSLMVVKTINYRFSTKPLLQSFFVVGQIACTKKTRRTVCSSAESSILIPTQHLKVHKQSYSSGLQYFFSGIWSQFIMSHHVQPPVSDNLVFSLYPLSGCIQKRNYPW